MSDARRQIPALDPNGRRARILRVAVLGPATLSEIERRVGPTEGPKRDRSIHRLKTTSAIRKLKQDGLLARSAAGWIATADGVALNNRLRGHA